MTTTESTTPTAADRARRADVLRIIDTALRAEGVLPPRDDDQDEPRSPHLQYNDRLADAITVTADLMARRAGVKNTIHGLYTSPAVGGACILAQCPQRDGQLPVALLPQARRMA